MCVIIVIGKITTKYNTIGLCHILLLFYYSIRLEFCQGFFRYGKIFFVFVVSNKYSYLRGTIHMNEIQIFTHEDFGEIRTIEIDGQIYFVGSDVAKALGYTNSRKAIADHVDKDDVTKRYPILDSLGRIQKVSIINESGLYSLILASKLQGAKKFKHWITSEVLPTIRKTGSYNPKALCESCEYKKLSATNVFLTDCKLFLNFKQEDLKNTSGQPINKKGVVNMNDTIEKLKPFLLDYVEEITAKSMNGGKDQYICPLCHSGTGIHHSGAFTVYPDTNSYHCFACGANGDIFNLYGEINHINNFKTVVDELSAKYNIFSYQPVTPNKKISKPAELKQEKDYTNFFAVAEQHLNQTDYLTKRGISPRIQQKFHCGYVPNFMYKGNQTTSAIIIPTSKGSYMWRSTTENLKRKRGTAHILNPSALNSPYCFVVEGEIDCMSVDECGFSCIGLGSTSNIRKIFDYDTSKTVLIIALDNDKDGRRASVALANECDERSVPYIVAESDVWGDYKDANELLIGDRARLISSLQEHLKRATTLNKDQWLKDTFKRKQTSFTSTTKPINKKPMIDYELFTESLKKQEYSIKYNQITHTFEFFGFDKGESAEHLAENVPTILQDQLKKEYTHVSKQLVMDYITRYATRNKYNPVLDQIKTTKWDGKDRIEEIYTIFRIPPENTEEGKYSRIYIKKWLMQTVCALFNVIECPFSLDIILIFKGRQGIGKTRFFEKLALKSQFFGEGICLDPRDKDSVMQATSKWISELGEIGSTMRKDMDSVKAFLTKSTDEYRTPYGKASLHYPRMTSFVGTVNDDEFLIDQTGNRRFATIPLPLDLVIDYETQIKPFNSLQLWSQVYEIIKDMDKASCFRLTEDEKRQLEKRNSSFVKPMKAECEVLDILEEQQTQEQGYICTFKEMTVLQFIQFHNLKYDANVIGKVLKKYGYESQLKRDNGKVTRVIKLPYKHWNNNNPY